MVSVIREPSISIELYVTLRWLLCNVPLRVYIFVWFSKITNTMHIRELHSTQVYSSMSFNKRMRPGSLILQLTNGMYPLLQKVTCFLPHNFPLSFSRQTTTVLI